MISLTLRSTTKVNTQMKIKIDIPTPIGQEATTANQFKVNILVSRSKILEETLEGGHIVWLIDCSMKQYKEITMMLSMHYSMLKKSFAVLKRVPKKMLPYSAKDFKDMEIFLKSGYKVELIEGEEIKEIEKPKSFLKKLF